MAASNPEHALLKAIRFFGSQEKLAKRLQVKRGVISHWLNDEIRIPLEYALEIEAATEQLVKWYELAPHCSERILRQFNISLKTQ